MELTKRKCYGCTWLKEYEDKDGTTYTCIKSPGIVLGYISAYTDHDEPYEMSGCYEGKTDANAGA